MPALPPSLLAQLARLTLAELGRLSPAERAEIAAALAAHEAATAPPPTYLEFLTSAEYCARTPSPMVQAIAEGHIAAGDVAAELADLCRGRHPGRSCPAQITVFKSVGWAGEDLAAAILATGG